MAAGDSFAIISPAWKRLAELIGHLDFLFLADCKASSWSNRGQIDRAGGIYCFPLAMTGHRPKLLADWVGNSPATVTEIFCPDREPTDPPVGKGFEVPLGSLWLDEENQQWHRWSERWLVIRSDALARRQIKGLEKRLGRAEQALAQLATRPGQDAAALQPKVDEILKRHGVSQYLLTTIDKQFHYLKIYENPGRPSPNSRFRRVRQTTLTLTYHRDTEAIASVKNLAGWRLYVTNAPEQRLLKDT